MYLLISKTIPKLFWGIMMFFFFFLKGEYSFILPWHGQLYTAVAFEMRFICFWLCVCVCLSICVSLCFAVRPSGPGDKSRMSDWEGQRARTITFQWNCRRKRLSLQFSQGLCEPLDILQLLVVGIYLFICYLFGKRCLLTWHWGQVKVTPPNNIIHLNIRVWTQH